MPSFGMIPKRSETTNNPWSKESPGLSNVVDKNNNNLSCELEDITMMEGQSKRQRMIDYTLKHQNIAPFRFRANNKDDYLGPNSGRVLTQNYMHTEQPNHKKEPISSDYFDLYKKIQNFSNSLVHKSQNFGEKVGKSENKKLSKGNPNKSIRVNNECTISELSEIEVLEQSNDNTDLMASQPKRQGELN